jgi:hypothetical protein
MKKCFIIVCLCVMCLVPEMALCQPVPNGCVQIKSGLITDANGTVITPGYDKYGYNYQAHMFNGLYENYSRPATPFTEGEVNLIMKWSDEWLSNIDCGPGTPDGKLDRGLDRQTGVSEGISKGWLTNHFEGECKGADGVERHFTNFVKIVWVGPAPAVDPWADKRIWGQYAVIEEVGDSEGVCNGHTGLIKEMLSKPAGFGFYTN